MDKCLVTGDECLMRPGGLEGECFDVCPEARVFMERFGLLRWEPPDREVLLEALKDELKSVEEKMRSGSGGPSAFTRRSLEVVIKHLEGC